MFNNPSLYNFFTKYDLALFITMTVLLAIGVAIMTCANGHLTFSIGTGFFIVGLLVIIFKLGVEITSSTPWHNETFQVEKYIKSENDGYEIIAKGKKYKISSNQVMKKTKVTKVKDKKTEMQLRHYQMNKGYKDFGQKPKDELIIYNYKTWTKLK